MSALTQEERLLWAERLRDISTECTATLSRNRLRTLARLLEAARDLPTDVLRIAAEHSGELADVVRATRQEERADLADLFAEYLQKTADGEPVDWDTVLQDLAAREMKRRGLEPGA